MSEITAGQAYSVECPFILDDYVEQDEDGTYHSKSWRPGIVWEQTAIDDARAVAHGMGRVVYTVIDIATLPHPYPARVFFTRKWFPPTGRPFGKSRLHVMTISAFKRRLRSYLPSGVTEDTEFAVVPPQANQDRRAA